MIGAVIDAAEAKVWFGVKDFIHRKFHTIHRSASALPGLYPFKGMDRMEPEGIADRNGVTHTGLRLIGRNHDDFSQIFYRFDEILYPGGGDAIVIGNKDN